MLWKDTFSFVSQIKNANISRNFFVSYDVASLFTNIPFQETIDIDINLIFNHNPNQNITKKELKKLFLFATSQIILFLKVSFIIKLIEQPWVLLWLVSLLISLWGFTNLSGYMNIILINLILISDMLMIFQLLLTRNKIH